MFPSRRGAVLSILSFLILLISLLSNPLAVRAEDDKNYGPVIGIGTFLLPFMAAYVI